MTRLVIIIICTLTIIACKDKSIFENESLMVSQFAKTINLPAEKINMEIIGINNLYIVDSILLGFKARGDNGFFTCYSLPQFKFLGNYVSAGRGADEFLTLTYNKQFTLNSSNINIWISSHLTREVSEINLTSTIEEQKVIFGKRFILDTISESYWFNINDSLFANYPTTDNLYYTIYNLKEQKILKQKNIFRKGIKFDPSVYDIIGAISSDKTKMALAMMNMNHIIIHSTDGDSIIPLTIFNHSNTPHEISQQDYMDRKIYYSDIRSTDEFIFALYINRSTKEIRESNKGVEIHVFHWNGKPAFRIIIPNYIRFFDIDQKNGYIYGLSPYDEEIFRYNINSILNVKNM